MKALQNLQYYLASLHLSIQKGNKQQGQHPRRQSISAQVFPPDPLSKIVLVMPSYLQFGQIILTGSLDPSAGRIFSTAMF